MQLKITYCELTMSEDRTEDTYVKVGGDSKVTSSDAAHVMLRECIITL